MSTTFKCTDMVGDGTHGQHAGTSMALCICSSVKQLAYIDVADIAGRRRRWLEDGEFTCCGNGSLMRTAPLAMLDPIERWNEHCDYWEGLFNHD